MAKYHTDKSLGEEQGVDTSKKPWPLTTICGIKDRINTQPDFQRPAVWSLPQKQLLIDTILRNYDVPKLYWRKVSSKPDMYEVIDGQQRLRAIWEYQAGEYATGEKVDPIDGEDVTKKHYAGLSDELRIRFDTYPLDVVVVSETDEEEVRDMFLRLQNGTTLKAQEKRNAMSGKMRDFVKALAAHPFFQSCAFKNTRYTFDHLAAQMTLIELSGGPTNIRDAELNAMYKAQVGFDSNGSKAKKVRRVLDYLAQAFPTMTPELERYNVISLYTLVSYLLERYVVQARHCDLSAWFIAFETERRAQRALPEDQWDQELLLYHEKISHSTDREDSVKWRHEYLLRKLLQALPDIEQKDDQRLFTHEQRLAIYRRDGGYCRVKLTCNGETCEWDKWEADHVVPWSRGGKTTVGNGQVACLACNAAKSNR